MTSSSGKYNKIFDFLSIMHFLIYFAFGILVKGQYNLVLLLGLLWEIFEYTITKCQVTRELLIKYWIIPQKIWDEDFINLNRISDLFFNFLGYYVGNQI